MKRIIHEIHRRSLWQVLAIYVAASWMVFEGVETLTDGLGLPPWFPALAFVLLLIGLPVVIATAFVQEGGPSVAAERTLVDASGRELGSGAETGAPTRDGPSTRFLTWPNALAAGIVAFALWGVVAAGWLLYGEKPTVTASPDGPETGERPSLAILPLHNLSPDPDNAYFAAGIHEEMLTHLSRVEGIDLISRTSVQDYADTEKSLTEIARELGVTTILEGSVQREGDGVRITFQLADARQDRYLWAESYDRKFADIFRIQTEVASRVVEELKGVLTPEERAELAQRPTDNLEAYAHYLRGHEHRWRLWIEDDVRTAAEAYEQAVELDPGFAAAWARVVQSRLWLAWDHGAYHERARAWVALGRLEEVAPGSPELRLARGLWLYYGVQRHGEALREFELLAEVWPGDVDVMLYRSALYRRLGRWEESVRTMEHVLEIDPANPTVWASLLQTYAMMRRFDEAERYGTMAVSRGPTVPIHWWFLAGYARLSRGDTAAARSAVDSAARHVAAERLELGRAMVHFFSGRPRQAVGFHADPLVRGFGFPEIGLVAASASGTAELIEAYSDRLQLLARTTLTSVPASYAVVRSRALSQLAVAQAYLGDEDEAIRLAREAVDLYPVSRDAFFGPRRVLWLAHVYTVVGRHDDAVDLLRRLLSIPAEMVTVPLLRTDPRWDALRNNPRFQELLEEHEQRQPTGDY